MSDKTTSLEEWMGTKVKLMKEFPLLTNADCSFLEWKKDEMLETIQKKIKKTKEELASIITNL